MGAAGDLGRQGCVGPGALPAPQSFLELGQALWALCLQPGDVLHRVGSISPSLWSPRFYVGEHLHVTIMSLRLKTFA